VFGITACQRLKVLQPRLIDSAMVCARSKRNSEPGLNVILRPPEPPSTPASGEPAGARPRGQAAQHGYSVGIIFCQKLMSKCGARNNLIADICSTAGYKASCSRDVFAMRDELANFLAQDSRGPRREELLRRTTLAVEVYVCAREKRKRKEKVSANSRRRSAVVADAPKVHSVSFHMSHLQVIASISERCDV
jgi:hypothetical protein